MPVASLGRRVVPKSQTTDLDGPPQTPGLSTGTVFQIFGSGMSRRRLCGLNLPTNQMRIGIDGDLFMGRPGPFRSDSGGLLASQAP